MALTDDEVRRLAVDILKAPTARDKQQKIGASNLANGCDFCLASNLMGDMRETPMLDRAYMGRVLGTSLHGVAEGRQKSWLAAARKAEREQWDEIKRQALAPFARKYPDAQVEKRIKLGSIKGYGAVGSTPDIFLPGEAHLFDWKGSKRQKLAIMRDFLWMQAGSSEPIFGRQHKEVKLSEAAYAKELVKMEYKLTGYFAQTQLYMRGKANQGYDVQRSSLIFIARDGTGWFDNPGLDGWEDMTKTHDLWSISFDYDEAFADAVWNRGVAIWGGLQSGKTPHDFARNEHCFSCSLDLRSEERVAA